MENKQVLITTNKKAYHDYFVDDTYECGIVLVGSEVKSLRSHEANLKDSYAEIKNNECFMINAYIAPYEKGSYFNKDPRRTRKLLLHKAEIRRLNAKVTQKGYTLVPLKLYFNGSLVKVELGLCRGKKTYDKRDSLKLKEVQRDIDRVKKDYNIK